METRIKRLERWNKCLVAVLVFAFVPWIMAAASKVLECETLKADNAKVDTIGAATVLLLDEDGKQQGGLMGSKDGAKLNFKDSEGKLRLSIGMFKGTPAILFRDKDGKLVGGWSEKEGTVETVKPPAE